MTNKALIYNPYWDILGGGERYVSSFAKFLLDSGWSVDILWPENFTPRLISRFGLDLGQAAWLPAPYHPSLSRNYRLLFWLSDGSLPVSFAKKTLIHMQFPFRNIRGRSLPNIFKSHFYTFVVNSYFTKAYIDAEFGVTSTVIYPPVATGDFASGKKEKLILYVGRFSHLTQAKGQHILLEAFRNIQSRLPGWKLILAGGVSVGASPQLMRELKSLAAGLPVRIVTDPTYLQVRNLYSRARIFWSASGFGVDPASDPTRVEHFGITVVEAMASGCIPIITDLGGHPEIVDNGENGYLWHDLDQLQRVTLEVASGKNLNRLSQKARDKCKIFDVTNFNSGFAELIG